MSTLPSASHAPGWRAGARLDVSAWADPAAAAGGPAWVTGRTPGELVAVTGPGARPCRVRLALPAEGLTLLWHDGFARGMPGKAPSLVAAMAAPGLLVVQGLAEPAELFCPEGGAEVDGDVQSFDTGAGTVWVVTDAAFPGRVVVAVGLGDAAETVAAARACLGWDFVRWFANGREHRALLEHLPGGEETPPALAAFEVMAGSLRARAPLDTRWPDRGDGGFALNDVPLLAATWAAWDPGVAEELLRSAVHCVQPDGFLSSVCFPSLQEQSSVPAWPGLARAVADFLLQHPASELAVCLPALERQTAWWLSRSDPHRKGLPTWPEASASPTPEIWDAELGSVGLAALLVRDLDALADIGALNPDPSRDDRWIRLERERLPDLLENHFFQAESGRFLDRYVGGDPVRRAGLGGLLAAGLRGMPEELRRRHLRDWDGNASLLAREGLRAWEPWPGDEAPPPVPVDLQFMAAQALAVEDGESRRPRALRVIRNRLLMLVREGGGLGPDLIAAATDPAWRPATAALLLYAIQECAGTAEVRPLSPALRWAEKNRRTLGLAVVGTLTLVVAAILAVASLRKDQSHAPQSTLAGLAKNKYVLGHYEEAIRIYEDLLREFPSTDMVGDYHQMMGNAHFHLQDWGKAEAFYRLAAAERPDFPQPLWNLAQALHRQGRSDEALAALDRLGKEFSAKHPGFVRKVADARTVILQQNQARSAHPRIPALPVSAP